MNIRIALLALGLGLAGGTAALAQSVDAVPTPQGELAFTVSIGVAVTVPQDADGAQALLRIADQMLYEAKRGGRNRVEVADTP